MPMQGIADTQRNYCTVPPVLVATKLCHTIFESPSDSSPDTVIYHRSEP